MSELRVERLPTYSSASRRRRRSGSTPGGAQKRIHPAVMPGVFHC
jgi:hypothetical protein